MEWCAEKSRRLQVSPTKDLVALAKLHARSGNQDMIYPTWNIQLQFFIFIFFLVYFLLLIVPWLLLHSPITKL